MPPTCPHGQPQGECLICKTLGMDPGGAGGSAPSGGGRRSRAASGPAAPAVAPDPGSALPRSWSPGPARQPGGYPPAGGPPGHQPRSLPHVAALVVVGLVVAGVAAWALLGVAFAILHLLELIVVAGAAGWVGYRIGHFRGRRGG